MSKVELVFDLGSKNIRVFKRDVGLIISEPSIAVVKHQKNSMQLVCLGNSAFAKIAKLSTEEQIVYPISEGAIKNDKCAILVVKELLRRAAPKGVFMRPNISVLVCVSCGLANTEKGIIEKVFTSSGANEVNLIESPIAVGQVMNLKRYFIMDIGAMKTELALVNEKGIVTGCSVDIAGEKLNNAIMAYVADKHRIIIQYHTTEKLKKTLGSMYKNDMASASISGKAIGTAEPKNIKIFAYELREAMAPVLSKLAEVADNLLNLVDMPPEFAEEIYKQGIFMCGGTCLIAGIEDFFAEKTHMPIHIIDAPESATVKGGANFFYNKDLLGEYLNLQLKK